MIQQQPTVSNEYQPTIAIITVNYYEKLAVDAMMTNKVTFMRHKTEGWSAHLSFLFSSFFSIKYYNVPPFFFDVETLQTLNKKRTR